MFAHSPVAHLIFGADGRPVACNTAYRELFGQVPPARVQRAGRRQQRVCRDRRRRPARAPGRDRADAASLVPARRPERRGNNGKRVAVECCLFPLDDGDSGVALVVVAYKDVTAEQDDITDEVAARRHTDALAESLRASERQLRLITNSLPALVTYMGHDRRFRFTNNAYMTWFGIEPQSLIGKHARELVGEVGYRQIQPYMERALAGETVQYERDVTLPDGRTIYTQMSYVPDKDEQGRTLGYVALIHDMTDRHRAELALQAERKRLHDILMNAPAAICPALRPRRGVHVRQREVPGHRWKGAPCWARRRARSIPMPEADRFAELMARVYATGEAVTGTEVPALNRNPDDGGEEAFINITYQPLLDAEGRIDSVVSFAVDVTEQVNARRRAERLTAALRESEARYRSFVNQSTEGIWRIELGEPVAIDAPVDEQLAAFYRSALPRRVQRRDGEDVRIRARRRARRQAAARAARSGGPAQHRVPARVHRERISAGSGRVATSPGATAGRACSATAWSAWSRTAGCGARGARSAT